jgi:uncharacterized protein (TIRG00374 family)
MASRAPASEGSPMTDHRGRQWQTYALVGTGITAVAYGAATAWVGIADVFAALNRVGWAGIALALALSLVNYGLRFVRWEAYLSGLGHRVPRVPGLQMYVAGFAWTVTPGKAGEALRGLLLERFGVPFRVTVAALLSERLSDLGAIVLLSLAGLAMYPHSQGVVFAGIAATLLGWFVLSRPTISAVARRVEAAAAGRLRPVAAYVADTLDASRRCHRSGLAALALALGIVAWTAEAVALYLILGWMGAEVPLLVATFAYAIAVLAGALSFIPGGLGSTEAVMVAVLLWQGVPAELAVASTLLIRITTLWFAVALGAAALASVTASGRS